MPRGITLCSLVVLVASVIAPAGIPAASRTNAFAAGPLVFAHQDRVYPETPHDPLSVSLSPSVTVRNASSAQLRRLATALDSFADTGLVLPDLEVVFATDDGAGGDHLGSFDASTRPWRVSICSDLDFVYEHELAHAWERGSLSSGARDSFMKSRGYTVWDGADVPWNQRGIEAAAFIIQQGLAGPPLPPKIGAEARSRLEAFELLTGQTAPRFMEWFEANNPSHANSFEIPGQRISAHARVAWDSPRALGGQPR